MNQAPRAPGPGQSEDRTAIAAERLQALRYSPFHRLLYVKNQKAGCTSIEFSLWKDYDRKTGQRSFKGRTHDNRSPIKGGVRALLDERADTLAVVEVFTAVRNPFTRVLSAYLHHVYDGSLKSRLFRRLGLWRSPLIRQQFYDAIRLDSSESLSFTGFVERLVDTPVERLTGHFRPQVVNVLWGELQFDFVGRLEEPEGLRDYLAEHDIDIRKRAGHAQHAGAKLDRFYDDRSIEMVAHHFATDFLAFGYDPGRPGAAPMRPIEQPVGGRRLTDFVRSVSER